MTKVAKILFLAANPIDAGYRPRLDEEAREMDFRILAGGDRDRFQLVSEFAVRTRDLQLAIHRHRPNILHFSGHGNRSQGIILEDEFGKMKAVKKEALVHLMEEFKHDVRVVVLNACYSKWQVKAFRHLIDYTVGMNTMISDKAAVAFSASFYQALTFGRSVSSAFRLAVNEIELEGLKGAKTPELFIKDGVDISKPFLQAIAAD